MTSNISYRCSTHTTYWSVITLSVWVFFWTAPISIGHLLISLSLSFWDRTYIDQSSPYQSELSLSFFGIAPISISHLLISLSLSFRDRTYIDRSSPCQSELSLSFFFGTTPISVGHLLISLSLSFRDRTYINRSFIFHVSLSSVRVFVPC